MAMRYRPGNYGARADTYFLMEQARTRPDLANSSSSFQITPMNVSDLPKAMRKIGWKKSAMMMERWLRLPAWECPDSWKEGPGLPQELFIPDQHLDDEIITMSWLRNYPAAVSAIDGLIAKCCSPAAMGVTAKRLKRLGWSGFGSYIFGRKNIIGRPNMSARELEQYYQNNFVTVGGNALNHVFSDTLDDIYGSLGTYNLKCAVLGRAYEYDAGKRYLEAQWVGVYVKDFYDFNNNNGYDQVLGLWSDNGIVNRKSATMAVIQDMNIYTGKTPHKVSLFHNSDFLKYRAKSNKGGDFVVFSDVYWQRISGNYPLPWSD